MRIGVSALLLRTAGGFQKAGICRYIIRLLDEFARDGKGHYFALFVPEGEQLPQAWLDAPHFEINRVPVHSRVKRVQWELFAPRQWIRLMGLDVWFSSAQATPFRCGAPRATMVHDLIPIFYPEFFSWEMARYQAWTLKHSCRNAELILTNSEATKSDIVARYHTSPERVVVTPLGPGNVPPPIAPSGVTDAELEKIGVPHKRFLFTLSTIEPRKNLTRLIEAMGLLAAKPEFEDVGLVVGGAKGWKGSPLEKRLEELKIADRVTFLGYVDDSDLPALFARCAAFIYPSIYEGFGMPILEAMLYGAPILTSKQAALMEVGGNVAQYFDPQSEVDICEAIEQALSHIDDRKTIVEQGFLRAQNFSWKKCAELTLEGLEGLRR